MGSKTKNNSKNNQKVASIQLGQVFKQLNEVDVTLFQLAVRMESLAKVLIEKGVLTEDEFRKSINTTAEKYVKQSTEGSVIEDAKKSEDIDEISFNVESDES